MSRRFFWFSVSTLAYNLFVIVFGAFVRATGSGAGCGEHWPTCDGKIVPRQPMIETVIEFTHRLTSGLALIMVVILFIWAWRRYQWPSAVTKASFASLLLILVEAGIGAGLVLFGLVGDNTSMVRAWVMAAHLVNTLFLLGALFAVAYFAYESRTPATNDWEQRFHARGIAAWPRWQDVWRPGPGLSATLGLLGFFLLAVSGAVTALGDSLFPAGSLAEGIRQDFSPEAHLLLKLRVWHPFLAVGLAAYWLFLIFSRRRQEIPVGSGWLKGWLPGTFVVTALSAQLTIGVVNLVLLAPVSMQLLHLLMADLCFLAAYFYWLRLPQARWFPAEAPAGSPAPLAREL